MNFYGWYDGSPNTEGTVALHYWNNIVNEYALEGEDQNSSIRYTKEHYVNACRNYMDKHTEVNLGKKFIIDIPLAEVWYNEAITAIDGYSQNVPIWKTPEWIEYVIKELDPDPRVIGWYQADEPEVWGYREVVNGNVVNNNPEIRYSFLRSRYLVIRSLTRKPIHAVFCDVSLYSQRYREKVLEVGPFFDVFMFDYYPFTPLNDKVDKSKFKEFIKIVDEIDSNMPVMFVGQGSGGLEFNNRVPTVSEHEELFKEFIRHCPRSRRYGYLLWSANPSYASPKAIAHGEIALKYIRQWEIEVDQETTKLSLFKRIMLRLRKFISIL